MADDETLAPQTTSESDKADQGQGRGGKRIEDYFTVGRGQSDFQAAQEWKRRAKKRAADLRAATERADKAELRLADATLAALLGDQEFRLALREDVIRWKERADRAESIVRELAEALASVEHIPGMLTDEARAALARAREAGYGDG